MSDNFTTLALIQLGMAFLMAISVMYMSYGYLHKKVAEKYGMDKTNIAFAIFASGVLFSVAYLLQGVIAPIIGITRTLGGQLTGSKLYLETFQYAGIFVGIGLALATIINFVAVFLFTAVTTKIDEFQELKDNNIAVGLITATIIIGIAILTKESMVLLIESLAPYPDLPTMR